MDEKKLRLLNDFQKLSEGKSSEDMIPLVLAFMEKAKKKILPFQRTKFQFFLKKQEKECHHNL